MERLYSLQGLRGAAVLGVVLFHMASVEAKYSGGDLLLPALVDFFQLGVDLFCDQWLCHGDCDPWPLSERGANPAFCF